MEDSFKDKDLIGLGKALDKYRELYQAIEPELGKQLDVLNNKIKRDLALYGNCFLSLDGDYNIVLTSPLKAKLIKE